MTLVVLSHGTGRPLVQGHSPTPKGEVWDHELRVGAPVSVSATTLQTSEVSVKKGQDVRPAPECPGLPQLSPQPGTKAWLREVSGLQGVERGL